jgi:hypothetical protein
MSEKKRENILIHLIHLIRIRFKTEITKIKLKKQKINYLFIKNIKIRIIPFLIYVIVNQ